jgi:hypothetical protein
MNNQPNDDSNPAADPIEPLVRLLSGAKLTVEQVMRMSDEHWRIVAAMADAPVPKPAHREMTVRRYRELQQIRSA